jgi:uncharacterized membrane protein YqaE (UPF0057 family)
MTRFVEVVICFFMPPVAVFMKRGLRVEFWLGLFLTLCFWVPGIVYALIVVAQPDDGKDLIK